MKITVFTPTFNRAHTLPKLYESLLQQTNKNFEWLIVDDGSTDNTHLLINNWINKGDIEIQYFYQKNAGKMAAHNYGAYLSKEELFMCVDSDDYLFDSHVIENIIQKWSSIKNIDKKNISGIIAQKHIINKNYQQNKLPDIPFETLSNLYLKYKYKGDTALIFQTNILKKYPFPQIPGEKFITEAYIYEQIDQKYKFIIFPCNLFTCEYMDDGYTQNWVKTVINNPKGWKMYYKQHIEYCHNINQKIQTIYRYIAVSFINKDKVIDIILKGKYKWISVLLLPIGWLKSYKDKKLYNKLLQK